MRSLAELAREICTLAGHINAAQHRWLMLIAEYDRRKGWSEGVSQSCAHWLNWKCGIALGAAREKVRVARALESLPKISAAMARGNLSYSKVREITCIAHEESEDYLLAIAEHGTAAHVEKLVRAYRRCLDAQELAREDRQRQSRCLSYRYDEDGSLLVTARLPAEAGARLLKALELAVEGLPPSPISFGSRRADALDLITESFLARGALDARGADRHQIVVHVAAETLRDGAAGPCHFEHGSSIAAATARRMACDASVVALVENPDHEPLGVGRKTRIISAPLRRLLTARDKGCRFPGCANTRYIDVRHVQHWANGGETKPSNLLSLCRFHHRAVHEGGIRIEQREDGALKFIKPDGAVITSVSATHGSDEQPGDWQQLPTGTLVNRWRGERMDYGIAVEALLLRQAGRPRNVPAGTSPA